MQVIGAALAGLIVICILGVVRYGPWTTPAPPVPTETAIPYRSLEDHLTAGTIRHVTPYPSWPIPVGTPYIYGIGLADSTPTPAPRDVTEIEQPHAWCYARGSEPLVCVLKEGAR